MVNHNTSTATDSRHLIEIKPRSGWGNVNIGELWRYRGLLAIFVWRDLKVRYKQTSLGIVWLLLQPIAMTVIYSVFFGHLARIPSGNVPYAIFVLSGIIIWQFFQRAVNDGSTSLAAQQALIGKIYFPRLIAPLTALMGAVVDFALMMVVLLVAMAYFGVWPSWTIVTLPFWLLGMSGIAMGIGLLLTGFDAIFRDVRYALAFALQIWYFLSPVIYPVELVPERFRWYFLLNPTTPFIQGFRSAVLGQDTFPPLWSVVMACATTVILFAIGLAVFQRMERNIVDRI